MSTRRRPPVSWADLLLYQSLPEAAQDAAEAAHLLGLPPVALPERAARAQKQPKQAKRKPSLPTPAATRFRLPLRCPQGFAVRIEAAPQHAAEPLSLPDWGPEEAAEVERMLSPSGEAKLPARPLLDLGRIDARWRSVLKRSGAGGLDIDRMVQTLARNEWPQPLPQRTRPYRIHDVYVCMDLHPDRQFLLDDYRACWKALVASRPNARMHVHEINGPACWEPLLTAAGPGQAVLLLAEPRLMPEAELRTWRDMAGQLIRQGAVVLWSLDWLPEAWSEHADAAPTEPPAVADTPLSLLLACLAAAVTVEPALVRALIHALQLPGGLALEQAVWCHPDLDGALPYRQWYPERQQAHLQRLREALPAIIDTCGRVLWESHVHVHQVQRDQELLNWADAAGEAGVTRHCVASALDDAKWRYARVAQHLLQLKTRADTVGLAGLSSPGVIRAAAMERWRSLPDCLGADRQYVEGLLLQAAEPHGAESPIGNPGGDEGHASLTVSLFQQGQRLLLVPIDFNGPGAHMAELNIDTRRLIVESDGVARVVWYPRDVMAQAPLVLAEWERMPPKNVRVRGTAGELRVDTVERPHWAAQFAQQPAWAGSWVTDRSGVGWGTDGLIHWPDGNPVALEPSARHGVVYSTPNGWQFEIDLYGPRLSYVVSTRFSHEALRVYFRYIPPGTYLQGSPEGIGDNDERPQHPVTLSQGLWLAETPCTQALWQAVMGNNPSHFKQGEDAPRRPVETVSWDDVGEFLKALQRLLPPGCEAVLPTESQWEYACRAGTQTGYWWGDEPDESKANVDMTGQRSWEDKDGITPVDRYPPNPWGLYDMHGNVWEWCADGRRDYADSPERDPEGPGDGDSRVVRGGSWFDHPVLARAASRTGRHRADAFQLRGFRFALRSPSGPEARPGGPGASRRGGAAGGRTVGADAPAAEPPRRGADDVSTPE